MKLTTFILALGVFLASVSAAYAENAPARTLVVAPGEGGQYRSINAAIQAARPGDRIVVGEGVYRESIVVDRNVEIVGEGRVKNVVVEALAGNCVQMRAAAATVRNLTLRCRAGRRNFFAVDIPQGTLTLENCDISSDSLSAIVIHGPAANPTITNCSMHETPQSGVWVYDRGHGTITNCQIWGNAHAGIDVENGADPAVRQSRIHSGRQTGVYVHDGGKGLFEACDITGNAFAGVTVRGGNPTLRECHLRDNKENGLWICDNGSGRFEKCDIAGSVLVGVDIQRGGNPTLQECRVANGKQGGVFVHDGGAGNFIKCDIEGNALTGVEVNRSGNPTLRDCRVSRNAWHGVYVHDAGRGTFENCDLGGNPKGATWIGPGCKVRITPPLARPVSLEIKP